MVNGNMTDGRLLITDEGMSVCMYVHVYACVYVCMDGWLMDGWVMYVCMFFK